jgi:hypothetical protein
MMVKILELGVVHVKAWWIVLDMLDGVIQDVLPRLRLIGSMHMDVRFVWPRAKMFLAEDARQAVGLGIVQAYTMEVVHLVMSATVILMGTTHRASAVM